MTRVNRKWHVLAGVLYLAAVAKAGEPSTERQDTIVVTGSWQPIPLDEADRAINSFDPVAQQLVSNTLTDFLRLDPSLDLRARAPNGIQTDVSIRGGSFGQTLVLLDGVRLNDSQSGHHNMDIPVPLEAVSRIEVLRGSGSTMYGSDAVGGTINFVTKPPEYSDLRVRTAAGNFGVNQQRSTIGLVRGSATQRLSVSRDFSSGFKSGRDYRDLSMSSATSFLTDAGNTRLILAHDDRPFGADQFYGNFNSWERTKTWLAAARQEIGKGTLVSLAYRRHTDLFVLYRDRPQVFTNRHATESYQIAIRRKNEISRSGTVHYGAENYHDSIQSSNLGAHSRNRAAAYGAVDFRALRRFSFTAGLRDELHGSVNHQLSPSIGAGMWLSPHLKLRTAFSHAFRMPTYTDLYYHDPATLGSPNLEPESAWGSEAGLDWNAGGRLAGSFSAFRRSETNGIDYVRATRNDIWRATNIHRLRFTGAEASVRTSLKRTHTFDISYSALRGTGSALGPLQSRYVFNYPVHSALAGWNGTFRGWLARTRVGALQRRARDAYAVWDVYLARARGRVHPFIQTANLSNARYEEIPGVVMPGRSIVGGIEIVLFKH